MALPSASRMDLADIIAAVWGKLRIGKGSGSGGRRWLVFEYEHNIGARGVKY